MFYTQNDMGVIALKSLHKKKLLLNSISKGLHNDLLLVFFIITKVYIFILFPYFYLHI